MNKNLLILGAGGHGCVVKEVAEAMGIFDKIDFLDDNSDFAIGKFRDNEKFAGQRYAFTAIGDSNLNSQKNVSMKEK